MRIEFAVHKLCKYLVSLGQVKSNLYLISHHCARKIAVEKMAKVARKGITFWDDIYGFEFLPPNCVSCEIILPNPLQITSVSFSLALNFLLAQSFSVFF